MQNLLSILVPPVWAEGGDPAFPLGTDSLGRDVLSRLIYGARTAMLVAFFASLGAMTIGTILAHVSGYFGGTIDWVIGRLVDVWMSFPPVILSLILMVGLGVGLDRVILAIILVDWTRFCRVLRSEVLVVTRHDYVAAARLLGFTHWQAITREVLPATLPLLITLMSLEMAIAVVVEAILSFVGLGCRRKSARLGPDDRRCATIRLSVAVEFAASRAGDFSDSDVVQPPRGRAAPYARRAACGNRTLSRVHLAGQRSRSRRANRRSRRAGNPQAVLRPRARARFSVWSANPVPGKSMIGRSIAKLLPPGFEITAGSLLFEGERLLRKCRRRADALCSAARSHSSRSNR